MATVESDRITDLAGKLHVLADPRRLAILDMLMEGVQCNCEIAARLGVSLNLVSYHVRLLVEAGLVHGERDPDDARWVYYAVDRAALCELRAGLERLLDAERIRPRHPLCGPRSVPPAVEPCSVPPTAGLRSVPPTAGPRSGCDPERRCR